MANDFTEIKDILNEYSTDIQNEIVSEAERLGKEGAKELRHISPPNARTGRYRKGWTSVLERTFTEVKVTIHNKTAYQLTHLLENGHRLTRNGQLIGNVKAYPHITPVGEKISQEFYLNVEQIIGGK